MRRCHFLWRIIGALFLHLHVGVTRARAVSALFLRVRTATATKERKKDNNNSKRDPAELGRAALKLQATTASSGKAGKVVAAAAARNVATA